MREKPVQGTLFQLVTTLVGNQGWILPGPTEELCRSGLPIALLKNGRGEGTISPQAPVLIGQGLHQEMSAFHIPRFAQVPKLIRVPQAPSSQPKKPGAEVRDEVRLE